MIVKVASLKISQEIAYKYKHYLSEFRLTLQLVYLCIWGHMSGCCLYKSHNWRWLVCCYDASTPLGGDIVTLEFIPMSYVPFILYFNF